MISRPRHPKSLAFGSALAGMLLASLALAADASPIDKASGQVSEALTLLKDVKIGTKEGDDHLEKARNALLRARAELIKAQGQESGQ